MVDEKKIRETLMLLKVTYPNAFTKLSNEEIMLMIKVWTNDFRNVEKSLFNKAIENLRNTKAYLPTIAEIKKEIATLKVGETPRAEDEWNKVLGLVRKYGMYQQDKAFSEMQDSTAYAVKVIGYQNICMASDQTWNKKEFIGEYEALKNRNIEYLQIAKNENNIKAIEAMLFKGE